MTLHDLVTQILAKVKKLLGRKRVAFIGHNIAAWVVRAVFVQSQYELELQYVPVGTIDVALPQNPSGFDTKDAWDGYCGALFGRLGELPSQKKRFGILPRRTDSINSTKDLDDKPARQMLSTTDSDDLWIRENQLLHFGIIRDTTVAFDAFLQGLEPTHESSTVRAILCPGERKFTRKGTTASQDSDSSTESSDYEAHMFVSVTSEERQIAEILRGFTKRPQVLIPTSPAHGKMASQQGQTQSMSSDTPFYDTAPRTHPIPTLPSQQAVDGTTSTPNLQIYPSDVDREIDTVECEDSSGSKARRYEESLGTESSRSGQPDSPTASEKSTSPQLIAGRITRSKEMASRSLQNGDLDEAKRLYDMILPQYKTRPISRNFFRMNLQVGQMNFARGNYKASTEILRPMLENQCQKLLNWPRERKPIPKSETSFTSKIARWLALSQWKLGYYNEARKTLRRYERILQEKTETGLDNASSSTLALILAYSGRFNGAWRLSYSTYLKVFAAKHDAKESDQTNQENVCLANHARVLFVLGKLEDANEHSGKALASLTKNLGSEHFITLEVSCLQAGLLVAQSKTTQAESRAHQTLGDITQRLGLDHPLKLQALETLVQVYKNDGRYSDANQAAVKLVHENVKLLGEDHPQTLRSQTILAEVLLLCGKWKEAEETQEEVINKENNRISNLPKDIEETEPGVSYPDLYLYRTTLAYILLERGEWDKAREFSIDVLVKQLDAFTEEGGREEDRVPKPTSLDTVTAGPARKEDCEYLDHMELLSLINKRRITSEDPELWDIKLDGQLANKFAELKQHDPSSPEPHDSKWNSSTRLHTIKIYPSMVQILHCLAVTEQVRDDADLQFARGILEMVEKIRRIRLGDKHRLTMNVMQDLAINYRLSGELEKSLETIENVVSMRKELLGVDHPDYLRARHHQAVTLMRLARWQESLDIEEKTAKSQRFLLGKKHPDTVFSNYTLGSIYHSMGRLEEADGILSQVVKDQMDCYGVNHNLVLRSKARRAFVLQSLGSQDKIQLALELYDELERNPRVVEHSKRFRKLLLQLRSDKAACFFELGNLKQASPDQREKYFLEAETLQRDIYNGLEVAGVRSGGAPRMASAYDLACTLKMSNIPEKQKEACELLEESIQIAKLTFGKSHAYTEELRATLANWMNDKKIPALGQSHTDETGSPISIGA